MQKKNDIEIEILSTGHIRFTRKDAEYNKDVKNILECVLSLDDPSIATKIQEFFGATEDISILLGDRVFCG